MGTFAGQETANNERMKALLVTFALILALMAVVAPDRVEIAGPRPVDLDSVPMVGHVPGPQ